MKKKPDKATKKVANQKRTRAPNGTHTPRVYPTERIIKALQKHHGLIYLAAKDVGCTPVTIYERARKEPEIGECIKTQREQIIDTAENKLFKHVQNGNPWGIGFVLKTLGKGRGYVEASNLQLTGLDGLPIQTEDVTFERQRTALLAIIGTLGKQGGAGAGGRDGHDLQIADGQAVPPPVESDQPDADSRNGHAR